MNYQIGDEVEFTDEFGVLRQNVIIVLNAYDIKGMLGIRGPYGCYVRKPSEVRKVHPV